MTTGQGLGHSHVLGQALVRLSTKNELVVPIEQEGPMFSFPKSFLFQVGEVGD